MEKNIIMKNYPEIIQSIKNPETIKNILKNIRNPLFYDT